MKTKRKGVFVGFYTSAEVKQFLERRAKINFKSVSQIIQEIIITEMHKRHKTNEQQNKTKS